MTEAKHTRMRPQWGQIAEPDRIERLYILWKGRMLTTICGDYNATDPTVEFLTTIIWADDGYAYVGSVWSIGAVRRAATFDILDRTQLHQHNGTRLVFRSEEVEHVIIEYSNGRIEHIWSRGDQGWE